MPGITTKDEDKLSVSHAKIEVYSTLGCKHCRKAKAALSSLGAAFLTIDMDEARQSGSTTALNAGRKDRIEYTLTRTVPQIYIGEDHIGGCDALLAAMASGEFANLLAKHEVKLGEPISEELAIEVTHAAPKEQLTEEQVVEKYKDYVMNNDPESLAGGPIIASPDQILQLSETLQRQALKLTDKFMNADGSRVRYAAMKQSPELQEYVCLSSTLQRYRLSDFSAASDVVRLSFFANLYNAMIVHANCQLGPAEDTPAARSLFFSGRGGNKYNICGQIFCPDDIEHGILRGNSRHPSQPEDALSFWAPGDPREVLALSSLDPRIHFVLNCGASSCPPIKVLGADPAVALSSAASAYLEAETMVQYVKGQMQVSLPKLLLWYRADFGNDVAEVCTRVCSLLSEQSQLCMLLKLALKDSVGNDVSFELKYGDYNWAVNAE